MAETSRSCYTFRTMRAQQQATNRLRIALFTDTFLPQQNGVVTSILQSAEELGRRGHAVLIVTPKPRRKAAVPYYAPGVSVVHVPSLPALVYPDFQLGMLGLRTTLEHMRAFDPDILHLHTPLSVGRYAVQTAKELGKPLVGTNHVYMTEGNAGFLDFLAGAVPVREKLASAVTRYMKSVYNACDLRLAPSRRLIEELLADGYLPPMEYLPNGIRLDDIVPLDSAERREMKAKLGLKWKVILHFGRISKEKNVDEVLRAFVQVRAKREDVSLLLIGGGPMLKSLQAQAKKLGVAKDTVITGPIPHRKLLSEGWLSLGDVFLTASRIENHSMVLLEAMAAGQPIVCCRDTGLEETAEGVGWLVPPGDVPAMADAVGQILADPARAADMRERSLARARDFSITHLTDRLVELYEGLRGQKAHAMKEAPVHA